MELAIIGRLFTGFGTGIISIAVPTYIGEVSTPDVRGTLGAAFQLLVTGMDSNHIDQSYYMNYILYPSKLV